MGILIALIPATMIVVVGFFVLFASGRTQGAVQSFGKYLAIWLFFLAFIVLVGAALAPRIGLTPAGMHGAGGWMMGPGAMGPRMMERAPWMKGPAPFETPVPPPAPEAAPAPDEPAAE